MGFDYQDRHSIVSEKALIDDYFEISSEPHRRYPTIADWPCLVIQNAVYFGSKGPHNAEAFRGFLSMAFDGWSRRVIAKQADPYSPFDPFTHEPFGAGFFERFAGYLGGSTRGSEVLSFEATPIAPAAESRETSGKALTVSRCRNIIVRGEIHQGYFALTMFLPIGVETVASKVHCHVVHQDLPFLETAFEQAAEPGTWGEALNWFYSGVVDALCPDATPAPTDGALNQPLSKMRKLVAEFRKYIAGEPAKAAHAPKHAKVEGRRKSAGENVTSKNPTHQVFTDFIGIILPEGMARPAGVKGPGFVSFYSNEDIKGAFKIRATLSYLEQMSQAFYFSVFGSGSADVIACYLRRGSAIYLSNIGSQRTPHSKDPLRFLVLYPNSGPYLDLSSAAYENRRWWLSRLIHRLLSAGTTRVKALRDLNEIYRAGEKLAVLERAVERLETKQMKRSPGNSYVSLSATIRRLMQISSGIDGSLLLRVNENRLAFRHMERHLADLEIVRIPGWQSYSAFVNRRLVNTYAKIGAIGERYDRLWSIIRTRMEAVEAQASVNLQRIGTGIAMVGLPAALTPIASGAFFTRTASTAMPSDIAQILTLCDKPLVVPRGFCALEPLLKPDPATFTILLFLSVTTWLIFDFVVGRPVALSTKHTRA